MPPFSLVSLGACSGAAGLTGEVGCVRNTDQIHAWVNFEFLLSKCLLGVLLAEPSNKRHLLVP